MQPAGRWVTALTRCCADLRRHQTEPFTLIAAQSSLEHLLDGYATQTHLDVPQRQQAVSELVSARTLDVRIDLLDTVLLDLLDHCPAPVLLTALATPGVAWEPASLKHVSARLEHMKRDNLPASGLLQLILQLQAHGRTCHSLVEAAACQLLSVGGAPRVRSPGVVLRSTGSLVDVASALSRVGCFKRSVTMPLHTRILAQLRKKAAEEAAAAAAGADAAMPPPPLPSSALTPEWRTALLEVLAREACEKSLCSASVELLRAVLDVGREGVVIASLTQFAASVGTLRTMLRADQTSKEDYAMITAWCAAALDVCDAKLYAQQPTLRGVDAALLAHADPSDGKKRLLGYVTQQMGLGSLWTDLTAEQLCIIVHYAAKASHAGILEKVAHRLTEFSEPIKAGVALTGEHAVRCLESLCLPSCRFALHSPVYHKRLVLRLYEIAALHVESEPAAFLVRRCLSAMAGCRVRHAPLLATLAGALPRQACATSAWALATLAVSPAATPDFWGAVDRALPTVPPQSAARLLWSAAAASVAAGASAEALAAAAAAVARHRVGAARRVGIGRDELLAVMGALAAVKTPVPALAAIETGDAGRREKDALWERLCAWHVAEKPAEDGVLLEALRRARSDGGGGVVSEFAFPPPNLRSVQFGPSTIR
eukprot:Rhum_TRINITY_DN11279_c0_g1::Rhum_TRINITY_DN11279_c0_g1_i1::g.43632::m.43632